MRMFLLLTLFRLLHLLISSSSGEEVNSSEEGGWAYELEGKLPKSADLNLCKVFYDKTCCSASRMLSASLALENLATHGEAAQDCLDLFELLECSICHPDVGTQSGPLLICDSVFEACSDAYFSTSNQVIVPCGSSNGTICEKASKLETNGTAFCEAMGFSVHDSEEEPCCGSKSILVTLMNTMGLQDLKYKLVTLCWIAAVSVLASTLLHIWNYQMEKMERNVRRLRRRDMNRRRF